MMDVLARNSVDPVFCHHYQPVYRDGSAVGVRSFSHTSSSSTAKFSSSRSPSIMDTTYDLLASQTPSTRQRPNYGRYPTTLQQ